MCKKTFEDGEYLVYCTNGIEIDMNFGSNLSLLMCND